MVRRGAMLLWLVLLLGMFSPVNGQEPGGLVLAVNHAVETAGERIAFVLDGAHRPRIFTIDGNEPRLVLDFMNCDYEGMSPAVAGGTRLVRNIRVGRHHQPQRKTRVVIDLTQDREVAWDQNFMAERNIFEIVIRAADAQPVAISSPQLELSPEVAPASHVPSPEPPNVAPLTSPQPREKLVLQSREKLVLQPREKLVLRADVGKVLVGGGQTVVEDQVVTTTAAEPAQATDHEEPSDVGPVDTLESEPESDQATATPIPDEQASETGTASQPAPVLQNVSFDNAFSQSGEMILLKLSSFQPPVITTQEKDPPRIFCDFAGATVDKAMEREIAANGSYVEKIRVVPGPQGVQVVLDLVPGFSYDLQQVYFKADSLFVLIVNLLEDSP